MIFKKKPKYIVIGIHGLSNKPPEKLLQEWWLRSINEGLDKLGFTGNVHFEMVCWSDVMYRFALDPTIKDPKHPQFIDEPYFPENQYVGSKKAWYKKLYYWLDDKRVGLFLSKRGLVNYEYMFDFIVSRSFKDLHAYYRDISSNPNGISEHIRTRVRQRLKKVLLKHKSKRIMLIAHSMGSIIANDVIYELQEQVEIHTLITMGSPLGLSVVKTRFLKNNGLPYREGANYPVPENVQRWHNFADPEDRIAVINDLRYHFTPNSRDVHIQDHLVSNDYKNGPTNNAHKSFGYLRTVEMAEIIKEFVERFSTSRLTRLRNLFRKR